VSCTRPSNNVIMRNPYNSLDELTRRQVMARISKALLGVGLLPQVFSSGAASADLNSAQNAPAKPKAKNIIYLFMEGGQSHIDTWDPKEGECAGPTKAIKTSADGVRISEYLPKTANQMHLGTIIRSMTSNQGAHYQGSYFMHTSFSPLATTQHPSLGAWLSHFQGPGNQTLPASVYVGESSRHPGCGFLPSRNSPLFVSDPGNGLRYLKLQKGLTPERHTNRMRLAASLDEEFHAKFNNKNVSAYREMYAGAYNIMKSEDLIAFDLSQEPEELRQAYGASPFGQGCLLARRLVERGVRFVEVGLHAWDTHVDNFNKVQDACVLLDAGLSSLVNDLQSRGLLKETLVVVASEFGRTPAIYGNLGRGHHPSVFSSVLFGGGVKAGNVHGASDRSGETVESNKVTVPDFNATLAYALGLPLREEVLSPRGRPFTVAHKGQPVTQIFG
jgi:hypothetical protein